MISSHAHSPHPPKILLFLFRIHPVRFHISQLKFILCVPPVELFTPYLTFPVRVCLAYSFSHSVPHTVLHCVPHSVNPSARPSSRPTLTQVITASTPCVHCAVPHSSSAYPPLLFPFNNPPSSTCFNIRNHYR